jgi:AraC family transcriptional regulator, transcriptional activator of pobA
MPNRNKIYSLDLLYEGTPMPFVIKTMEEIDEALGGIADNPHRHNYYTVIWPTKATGKHVIDFREYPILPDHLFFVSPWQVHQVITDPRPTGYVILFTSEFLEKSSIRNDFIANLKLFNNIGETPPLPLSDSMAATLKTFVQQMQAAFSERNAMFLEVAGAYLKLFLIECNGHCALMPDNNTQTVEVGRSIVKSFKASVEEHFNEWHQVQQYAGALNVTPNYLNEVIRMSLQVPAKEYIQGRIILEAKRLVVFTSKSAKEIGFELGFEDPSHFSKFFKSNTGQSLLDFRAGIDL